MRPTLILLSALALQAAPAVSLPVERASEVFFVRTTINGAGPYWLTVDTGATLTVLDPRTARQVGLAFEPTAMRPDVGVGARVTTVFRAPGATIAIAGVPTFRPAPIFVVGVSEAEGALGHRIDGVLGHDFLQQHVVEFDYAAGAVWLHPAGAEPAHGRRAVRVRTNGNRLVVPATLTLSDGQTLTAHLLVDTGSSSGVSLNTPFAERHDLEARFPSAELSAAIGVNGMTVRAVMHLRGLSIGSTSLPVSRVALSRDTTGLSASDEFDGILGGDVLRHATLVVDYPRRSLTLYQAGPVRRAVGARR